MGLTELHEKLRVVWCELGIGEAELAVQLSRRRARRSLGRSRILELGRSLQGCCATVCRGAASAIRVGGLMRLCDGSICESVPWELFKCRLVVCGACFGQELAKGTERARGDRRAVLPVDPCSRVPCERGRLKLEDASEKPGGAATLLAHPVRPLSPRALLHLCEHLRGFTARLGRLTAGGRELLRRERGGVCCGRALHS